MHGIFSIVGLAIAEVFKHRTEPSAVKGDIHILEIKYSAEQKPKFTSTPVSQRTSHSLQIQLLDF